MEFTKILLHKNQHSINNEVAYFDLSKKFCQECLDKVSTLGIEMQGNELELLFQNPKAFITEKLTKDRELQVGGLQLNKEKLFDLIEKPKGTNEVIASIIEDCRNQSTGSEPLFWFANRFCISKNEVMLKPEELERITLKHSIFIESENQQNGYNKVIELVQLVNDINKIAKHKIGIGTELNELITTVTPNDYSTYKVRIEAIKRFV